MHLLGHACPLEMSSVVRSAFVTRIIDFWDTICAGTSNISCSFYSGDVNLYRLYTEETLWFRYGNDLSVPYTFVFHIIVSGNVMTCHSYLSLQLRHCFNKNYISEMIVRTALCTAKRIVHSHGSLLGDCYPGLIPSACIYHYIMFFFSIHS